MNINLGITKSISKEKYAYVMASTLNQMVNYIPLKKEFEDIELTSIYNVTLFKNVEAKEKLEENKKWDKYFEDFFKEKITDIPIEQADWLNVSKVISIFKTNFENETKPIFWNITGGQRPFLMAVWEFTKNRPNDIIAYLEGNTGKMILSHGKSEEIPYSIEVLNIESAFKLMGYNIKNTTSASVNLIDKYVELWKLYKSDEQLRKEFIISNTKAGDIDNVKNLITDISLHFILDNHKGKEYPFGYILEDIVVAVLKKEFEGKIAEVAHSIKLEFNDDSLNKAVGNKILDEFDILLLTKTGQLYNFECKSGGMSGDVAKSTKYSTYAIAGVYGKPILITPLIQTEIDSYTNLSDEYKYIKSAIRSAKRATLEVWGIDEIVTKIEEKLKIK
jgi:hypothetical protein